jgi:hypothetical protein
MVRHAEAPLIRSAASDTLEEQRSEKEKSESERMFVKFQNPAAAAGPARAHVVYETIQMLGAV